MNKVITLSFLLMATFWVSAQEDNIAAEYLFDDIEAYLYSPNHERKKSREYFTNVKVLAESQNHEALYYLGMLQKEGIGTKVNFKKSLKSFKKAFDLGNTKAAYLIGYYYLKGFGNVQQDYKKAYRWFKKSDEKMALHWIAKMEFLGLGRKVNKQKAISILKSNDLYNSEVLLPQYEESMPSEKIGIEGYDSAISTSSLQDLYELKGFDKTPEYHYLEGTWQGQFYELDWASSKIFRTLPTELTLTGQNGVNDQLKAEIKIADSLASDVGSYSAGALRFGSLALPVKKQYTDYPNFTHLMTEIDGIEFRKFQTSEGNFLIGKVSSTFPVWKERGNPSLVILKKKDEINSAALTAFEKQVGDFIRLYPNPFKEHCLINFELSTDADVSVEITNYYDTPFYHDNVFTGRKAKGNHTLEVYNLPSRRGSYLISIKHNGSVENKIIIKN
ncbi:SEL1-like repeat protein [Flagellimonas sp. HMM57]|uniref:SEL1-like repeat protein n=1 Tax=unclassified Flagellimonas TaxID=2644544 RepID=UPI0013D6FC5C|nr:MULTISPECIES: SEL1-like repeat protein [unclassified Flagellimonas]UII77764.1 SEL1-like repeat protein [Flagellimonas sp. HMM57]